MKHTTIASLAKSAVFAAAAGAVALGLAAPAGASSTTMYGDPVAAAQWWRHQKYDDCVLMASADVIGQITGKEPSEEAIIRKAQSTPSVVHPGTIYTKPLDKTHPNSGMGTSFADVPTLLEQYDIAAVVTNRSRAGQDGVVGGVEGLKQQLRGGHTVIVSVNGELIWNQPVDTKDEQGNPLGDHAVVVTGIDTATNVVHLNDSGDPDGRDSQVPMALFLRAWDSSNELMVVTT